MTKRTLPEGYRIVSVMHGGSGRGDEQFRYDLEWWTTYTYRRWFRTHTETGWVTLAEGRSCLSADEADYAEHVQTARLHHRDQRRDA